METPGSIPESASLQAAQPLQPKLGWWARRRLRNKKRETLAKDFDLGWMVIVLSASTCISQQLWLDNPTASEVVHFFFIGCGFGLCAYLGHILLARLQCSLLELLALIFMLGNVLGVLLTIPSVYYMGWAWMPTLFLFLVVWILLGAVMGITHARILGVDSQTKRLLFVLGAWIVIVARACLLAGLLLFLPTFFGPQIERVIGARLTRWGPLLILIGLAGIAVDFFIARRVKRAARKILNET